MNKFLIKYGEIGIKGKNRGWFEQILEDRIKDALSPLGDFSVERVRGRFYAATQEDIGEKSVIEALCKVFGITSVCPMKQSRKSDYAALSADVLDFIRERYDSHNQTFKVNAKRADKYFPLDSQEINMELGHDILEAFPGMKVDVHSPEIMIHVEVRDEINIYSDEYPGPGGMPCGSAGKGMLLLSGGIDSPVAGYMMAKRGLSLEAVYFHAPPYTSERAKMKVVDLAKIVARYSGSIKLYVVNFTDIQLAIYDKCPHDELTIIMRRYMMRIAEHFAKQDKCGALITGESLGQVASQTLQSLECTDEVCNMPVFRPLIGFDKNEIVDISKKIETYETSILPYEDCCTIFVAKHPVTKPKLNIIKGSETKLNDVIDELFKTAIDTAEVVCVGRDV